MEIERKFAGKMSDNFTTIFGTAELHSLEQFYTYISKNEEVRYRTTDDGFVKTVKKGKGLTREETERPITEDEWNEARKNVIGNYIEKERMKIPFGDLTIEIDVYSRPSTNRWTTIEIEFPDEERAKSFSPEMLPDDVSRAFMRIIDVTDDERFKNKNIALIGFPTFMDRDDTTIMTIRCNCGERDAVWKGTPTPEFAKEYPDEDWYFCEDCIERLFAGVWSGGGPFGSDFMTFDRIDENGASTRTTTSIDVIIDNRDGDFMFDELTGEIADEICRRYVKRDPESEKHEDIKDIIRDRLIAYRDGKPLKFDDKDKADI